MTAHFHQKRIYFTREAIGQRLRLHSIRDTRAIHGLNGTFSRAFNSIKNEGGGRLLKVLRRSRCTERYTKMAATRSETTIVDRQRGARSQGLFHQIGRES